MMNFKVIILLVLFIVSVVMSLYVKDSTESADENRLSYHKLSKELNIIKQIDSYYGKKTQNKRKINSIISKYNNQMVYKKENKKSIEFKISKLNDKKLNKLNKEILNTGLKISRLKIKRLNSHISEFSCKVIF